MHVGLLTGGGDCPGLNAVIRAVTLALAANGVRVIGTRRVRPLDAAAVQALLAEGGTLLGTHNRCDPFRYFGAGGADVSAGLMAYVRELGLDVVVAIGGDGTMSIAHRLQLIGLPVVGVPKTIDNDLRGTDRSFGFDSAVAVVADALDRLRTTARSHGRVMIVETMGRYAGWIALAGGIAGGADVILLPETPYDVAAVAAFCRSRKAVPGHTLVCIAEGARAEGAALTVHERIADSPDPLRLGGVGQALQRALEPQLTTEVRTTLLGHLQRGGSPTPFDRILATRLGCHAAELVERGEFGRMVAVHGDTVTNVPLAEAGSGMRPVPPGHELLEVARRTGVMLGR
jgi:6-phosphofructokinase 1